MPTLPAAARDHMSGRAKVALASTNSPVVVDVTPAPIVVRDTDDIHANGLVGHAGVQDIFVLDMTSPDYARIGEAISGFEAGLDKLVFVNAEPTEFVVGVDNLSDRGYDEVVRFSGLTDDPSMPDGHVVFRFNATPPEGYQLPGGYAYIHIFAIDASISLGDISVLSGDPFL